MKAALAVSGLLALGLVGAPAAGAHAPPATSDDSRSVAGSRVGGHLRSLNNSGGSGTADVSVRGDQVTVSIRSTGLSPNLPHAQHLHIGGRGECPTPEADANGDGLIDTAEGQPSYGEVKVSLTTTGDVGAASALAVDRFPVAGADGTLDYQRTFTLPSGVTADEVRRAVVVQHGVAKLFGDPTAYDGDPRSSLDPSLPLEATIPSTCGELEDEGLLEALLELLGLSRDDDGDDDRNGLLGLFDDRRDDDDRNGLLGLFDDRRDDDERRRGGDDEVVDVVGNDATSTPEATATARVTTSPSEQTASEAPTVSVGVGGDGGGLVGLGGGGADDDRGLLRVGISGRS